MKLFEQAAQAESKNKPFAVVTLIATQGRVPRRDGRMVVFSNGQINGTIGGGQTEREAIQLALESIRKDKGGKYFLKVRETGMAEIFIDVPIKRRRVVIIGSGHVAQALAEEFHRLDFEVYFVDDRQFDVPVWATLIKKEGNDEEIGHLIDDKTAVIFSNPDDVSSLLEVVQATETPYIGILSSRKRRPLKTVE